MPPVPDRLLRLLDHPFLARLQTALFVGTVLVPALALLAAGIIVVVIGVGTAVVWQLLIAPTVALFLVLWWLFGLVYRHRRSEGIHVRVAGLLWEDFPDNKLIVQVEAVVLNQTSAPTRLNRWALSGRFAGAGRDAVHLRSWQRFYGRAPLAQLDTDAANTPLAPGEEREGYVSFAFIDTPSAAIRAVALTLSVHDEKGRRSTTTIDLPALKAMGEHKHSSQPAPPKGSFVIGGPGQTVENSVIEHSYSNNPDGFGGIYGDVKDSRMSGNVHDPPVASEDDET